MKPIIITGVCLISVLVAAIIFATIPFVGVAWKAGVGGANFNIGTSFTTALTILELYIVVFTIGIAILGIFGYRNIQKTVRETVLAKIAADIVNPETELGQSFVKTIKEQTDGQDAPVEVRDK